MGETVVNSTDAKQYIVINVGNERYGIDIQYVDNIVRMQRVTRVPKAQEYFPGVINIRGEIIPVMSLRVRFGLEPDVITNHTRILIIKIEPQAAVGIIVDEVKNVITLEESQVDHVTGGDPDKALFVNGVGKHEEGLVTLINLTNVIIDKELQEK